NTEAGALNNYTVTAVDAAGLESEPATPVRAGKISNSLRPPAQWLQSMIDRERNEVRLNRKYDQKDIRQYRIYRGSDDSEPVLYRSVSSERQEFTDRLIPGKKSVYTILAVFQDGRMSELSRELEVNY